MTKPAYAYVCLDCAVSYLRWALVCPTCGAELQVQSTGRLDAMAWRVGLGAYAAAKGAK